DPTSMVDVDGDGFADSVDTDDNTVAGTGDGGTMLPLPNTDGTGGLDYQDIDSDGDGIVDNIEGQPTVGYVAPSGTDTDGDGIDDSYDPDDGGTALVAIDTDMDGSADYIDT
ncbi:gliding motility-associated C-terminal domain-containing protein, partial [Aquimarina hainanensis]